MPLIQHPVTSYLVLIAGALVLLASLIQLVKPVASSSRYGFGLFTDRREDAEKNAFMLLRWMCVADVAYILLGIGSGGADGLAGALLMLVFTGAARALAWISLSRLTKTAAGEHGSLKGIGRVLPVTATLYTFGMFAALGVSPFLTPDAKPLVLHSTLASGLWFVPALMTLASAVLAVRTIQTVHGIWLEKGTFPDAREELFDPKRVVALGLAVLLAIMGIFGHNFMSLAAWFAGADTLTLPDFAVNWHGATLVPFIGAFVVWALGTVSRDMAKNVACVLMGLSFLIALTGSGLAPLNHLFAVVVSGIGLLVTVYSCGYIHKPEGGSKGAQNNYYFFLLLLFGSLTGIAASENLLSLFVFWELMTATSYVLVSYENTREAHAAAVKYYVMCTVAAAFLLPGLLLLSTTLGTLEVSSVAIAAKALSPGLAAFIAVLALIGYGVKAGLVPGHSWLPDAHPAAPSSVSGPLSGVLTKAGIFGLIQLLFAILGTGVLLGNATPSEGIPGIGVFVVILGLVTMLYGELMALRQKDIKRLLAYSTMGQVGEITMTLGLCTWLAATGALMHLINHAVMKDLLFLCSGILIMRAGTRNLDGLKGLGRAMPFTAGCMVVGLLSIMGLPPFAGFMSKFAMLYALADQAPVLAGVMLLASMAGCVYYTRIIRTLIFEPYEGPAIKEAGPTMAVPVGILAGLCIVLGLFPGIVLSLVEPVVQGFAASGKVVPQILPELAITWPPYSLFLMLAAFVPVYLRKQPERAGRVTGWLLVAASLLVILFGQGLDGISFWFALLVPVMGALNMFYASGYMNHSHTQWRFYAFFLFMSAGLTGVAASTDLYNFFLFWEIMSSWSLYFVIVHEENADALREGFKYFFFNVLGAAFLFLGVVLLVNWCGGAEFSRIAEVLPTLSSGQITAAILLMAIGFVMKAAQLPFRIDIQMHPATAPTPVSGYISSVLLKSAIFGLAKLFLVMGGGIAAASVLSWFGQPEIMEVVMWIGAITIVMAGGYAVFQQDVKLVLIYSTVSQLGYMVVGVALGTSLGVAGGLLHLVNHMLFKDLLFLVAGSLIVQTHSQNMDMMGGLASRMPKTLIFFVIGALCVVGVPPSNGFTSKWIIYHALMDQGQVLIAILSLVGSVITLAYFAKMMHSIFLGEPMPGVECVNEAPRSMTLPMAIIAGACVVTSVFPGLALMPINSILADMSLPVLEIAPWGIASGSGAWNATTTAILFAVVLGGGWLILNRLSVKQRVTDVHTCGIDPAELHMHTRSRDIYTAPADALASAKKVFKNLLSGGLSGRAPRFRKRNGKKDA